MKSDAFPRKQEKALAKIDLGHAGIVCDAPTVALERIDSTDLFHTLGQVEAVGKELEHPAKQSLFEIRGYKITDLYALAEIGYHYFRSGGLKLAEVIFEGLVAVKPDEAYFALALGLARDYLGDRASALHFYERAAKLDPKDPRPELNAAEIALQMKDWRKARHLLHRAAHKAANAGNEALERKADALLEMNGL